MNPIFLVGDFPYQRLRAATKIQRCYWESGEKNTFAIVSQMTVNVHKTQRGILFMSDFKGQFNQIKRGFMLKSFGLHHNFVFK